MKTYARIDLGIVAELFSTAEDITTLFHPDLVWVDVGLSAPQVGWQYSGGVFSPPPAAPLPERQAAAWERIQAERDRRWFQGGVLIGANWFASDQTAIMRYSVLLQLGAGQPAGTVLHTAWRTLVDGVTQDMTADLAKQILQAGLQQHAAIDSAAETHRANMLAAADPGTYDFSAGWPAVFPGVTTTNTP